MTTIKIKSTDVASQGEFVTISLSDFDSGKHEPFDDDARTALAGAVASGEVVPSASELLAARDALHARERQLAAEEARVAEQALANEAEAQRLADLAAASAAAAATAPSIPADIAAMSKDELHAALIAKGISFPAAANKAELQALLVG